MFRPNYFQKLANATAAMVVTPIFLAFIFLIFIDFSNAKVISAFSRMVNIGFVIISIIIISCSIIWHIADLKSTRKTEFFDNNKWWSIGFDICRFLLASIILLYAIGKLLGTQLQSSILWQGDELGKMSGFELTWAFFGYSKFYNSFIAFSQIIASFLLLFRRTTLLGACLLLPILINIVVIDYSFGILGPFPLAIMLLYMCLFLIACFWRGLIALFIKQESSGSINYFSHVRRHIFTKIAAAVLLIIYTIGFNYVKILKLPPVSDLDGAWHSVKATNYSDTASNYENFVDLYIERNYASIKRPYSQAYYQIKLGPKDKSTDVIFTPEDSNASKPIIGKYNLVDSDSLTISGTQERDSIQWIFKKKTK